VLAQAGAAGTYGTGGMRSKLLAAKRAAEVHGSACVIANGRQPDVISRVMRGDDVGTFIPAQPVKANARTRWLMSDPRIAGTLTVDSGAKAAMQRGKSLLLVGVTAVEGGFVAGDVVDIRCDSQAPFARGIVRASAADTEALKGLSTQEAAATGRTVPEPLVHRDDYAAL